MSFAPVLSKSSPSKEPIISSRNISISQTKEKFPPCHNHDYHCTYVVEYSKKDNAYLVFLMHNDKEEIDINTFYYLKESDIEKCGVSVSRDRANYYCYDKQGKLGVSPRSEKYRENAEISNQKCEVAFDSYFEWKGIDPTEFSPEGRLDAEKKCLAECLEVSINHSILTENTKSLKKESIILEIKLLYISLKRILKILKNAISSIKEEDASDFMRDLSNIETGISFLFPFPSFSTVHPGTSGSPEKIIDKLLGRIFKLIEEKISEFSKLQDQNYQNTFKKVSDFSVELQKINKTYDTPGKRYDKKEELIKKHMEAFPVSERKAGASNNPFF